MAKSFPYFTTVGDVRVGYSAATRNGLWEVYFRHGGERVRRLTRCEVRGKMPGADFHDEAKAVISAVVRPPSEFPTVRRFSWDEAVAEVERTAPHTRSETVRSFRAAIKALLEACPDATEPAAISEERVKRFCRLWLAAPSKQGRAGGRRSPVTLSYYVRALSALSNHLVELGILSKNMWRGVKVPKGERNPKPVPTEADVTHFFVWLAERYPEWVALSAFFETKAVCGCRTADLCKLPTSALAGGRLTFAGSVTKTKEGRSVLLPDDLFALLERVAGREHLWGRLFDEIPRFRKQSNGLPDSFSWKTVYHVVNNVCREYSDAHPDRPRFRPHGLRRRALTLGTMATGGKLDKAARAFGVHPSTARNNYVDGQRAFDVDETMKMLAPVLRPKIGVSVKESTMSPPEGGPVVEKP